MSSMPNSQSDATVPSLQQAKARAFILRHVAIYALSNPPPALSAQVFARWSVAEQTAARREAAVEGEAFWAKLGPLRLQLSPREEQFARTNMATMTEAHRVAACWRAEALQTLLWALGVVTGIPPYDTATGDAPIKALSGAEFDEALASAELRPPTELAAARGTAELWLWRARTRQIIEEGKPFPQSAQLLKAGLKSYDDIVRVTAKLALKRGTVREIIDEDFAILGKAYRSASTEEYTLARSIATERLFTLNWLCGRAPEGRWDETPTDT